MWPIQWLTPIKGIFQSNERVLATKAQILRGGPIPGPFVYAIKAVWE